MAKSAQAFRSIGEVATLIGVAPHVLRYWETQFTALKPMKRPDGRRYYRPADVELAAGICSLLRDDGLTIKGARKMITTDRGAAVRDRGAAQLSGTTGAPPLPLFPEMSAPGTRAAGPPAPVIVPASHPRWLRRLTALACDLQGVDRAHPRFAQIHDAALALAQAMLRLP